MLFSCFGTRRLGGGRDRITIRLSNNKGFTRLYGEGMYWASFVIVFDFLKPLKFEHPKSFDKMENIGKLPQIDQRLAKVNNRNIYHQSCVTQSSSST